MKSLKTVQQISGKIAPGRHPSYTEAHVLKALELIGSKPGVGRQQLSKELRMGEGTIRTLVNRSKNNMLIATSRGGMTLTGKGRKVLNEITGKMVGLEFPDSSITVGSKNYGVIVRGIAASIRKGIEQRDKAIIAGAKGATTLFYDGDEFKIPGMDLQLGSKIKNVILKNLKPEKGDVIIIGSAHDLYKAEIGAKSAALDLLLKEN
jgi:hypothetical protein